MYTCHLGVLDEVLAFTNQVPIALTIPKGYTEQENSPMKCNCGFFGRGTVLQHPGTHSTSPYLLLNSKLHKYRTTQNMGCAPPQIVLQNSVLSSEHQQIRNIHHHKLLYHITTVYINWYTLCPQICRYH